MSPYRMLRHMQTRCFVDRQEQPTRPLELRHRFVTIKVEAVGCTSVTSFRFSRNDHPLELHCDPVQLEGDVTRIPKLPFSSGSEI